MTTPFTVTRLQRRPVYMFPFTPVYNGNPFTVSRLHPVYTVTRLQYPVYTPFTQYLAIDKDTRVYTGVPACRHGTLCVPVYQ